MAKQSRELYITGNPVIDRILDAIAERLDVLEGLRPDLSTGFYSLGSDKTLDTTEDLSNFKTSLGLGTMADQNSNAVDITGGEIQDVLIQITDFDNEVIHEFPIMFLAQTSGFFGFE